MKTRLVTITWRLILPAVRSMMGGWFVYGGVVKVLQPVAFLKVLHEYDLPLPFAVLNAIAAWLPWFEIFCGLLLVSGRALRATTAVWLGLLIPFTFLILRRALAIRTATEVALCSIRFDCGCGTGEQAVCLKLAENTVLTLLLLGLYVFARPRIGSGVPTHKPPQA
jgi:putative oxidoreductase